MIIAELISMSKSAKGRIWIFLGLAVLIVIIVVATYVFWPRSSKILEVTAHSINPNEMKVGSFADLGFTIKNNDEVKPHQVKVVFNTTSVTFYLGNTTLSRDNGLQYFPTMLQPSQKSSFILRVTGTLPTGATTSTYSIPYDFFDENSTKFGSATESLKLNSP